MSKKENESAEDVMDTAEADAEVETGAEAPEHAELTGMLEDARSKADEHWNQCLRLQADIDNLSRRAERDVANAHKYALDRFAQDLLPVRDSLEMGLSASVQENTDPEKLREGVELTLQMMTGVLEKKFVPIEANAKTYDRLFKLYRRLHDSFGTDSYQGSLFCAMKELLKIRDAVRNR